MGGFNNPFSLYRHLKSHNKPPELPPLKQCDDRDYAVLQRILQRCFQRDPSMRPNATALLCDCTDIASQLDVDCQVGVLCRPEHRPGVSAEQHHTFPSANQHNLEKQSNAQ